MLEGLDAEFQRWRTAEILSSELLDAIHQFHQQESRDLWSMYQSMKEPEIVARGFALGLISTPLSEELRAKLDALVEFYGRRAK